MLMLTHTNMIAGLKIRTCCCHPRRNYQKSLVLKGNCFFLLKITAFLLWLVSVLFLKAKASSYKCYVLSKWLYSFSSISLSPPIWRKQGKMATVAKMKTLSTSGSGKRVLIFHYKISRKIHDDICSINSKHKFSPDKSFVQAL